mmetsp:Transcript_76448/g.203019  ORF Transcript_76448/g.203019 Transcript_76448/m.203019 type:complete len:260 (-) Transcript_76448:594-1373(-)
MRGRSRKLGPRLLARLPARPRGGRCLRRRRCSTSWVVHLWSAHGGLVRWQCCGSLGGALVLLGHSQLRSQALDLGLQLVLVLRPRSLRCIPHHCSTHHRRACCHRGVVCCGGVHNWCRRRDICRRLGTRVSRGVGAAVVLVTAILIQDKLRHRQGFDRFLRHLRHVGGLQRRVAAVRCLALAAVAHFSAGARDLQRELLRCWCCLCSLQRLHRSLHNCWLPCQGLGLHLLHSRRRRLLPCGGLVLGQHCGLRLLRHWCH